MSNTETELHSKMKKRDTALGAVLGGATGAIIGKTGVGRALAGTAGAVAGAGTGRLVGAERAAKDKLKQERHIADREIAQEHRKELIGVRKTASTTIDGVKLAAMVDELSHIKVAINIAPMMAMGAKAMGMARGAAPSVLNAAESVGSRITGGAMNMASKAKGLEGLRVPSTISSAGTLGQTRMGAGLGGRIEGAVTRGLAGAETAVGGTKNLNRLAGGAAIGAGTLAAGGVAKRMLGGGQQQQARY